jgi:hypothetical protein
MENIKPKTRILKHVDFIRSNNARVWYKFMVCDSSDKY